MGSTSANNDERQFVLAKYDYIAQGNQELDMKRNEAITHWWYQTLVEGSEWKRANGIYSFKLCSKRKTFHFWQVKIIFFCIICHKIKRIEKGKCEYNLYSKKNSRNWFSKEEDFDRWTSFLFIWTSPSLIFGIFWHKISRESEKKCI